MNKNNKQVRAAKAKEEEAVLNRILYWFAGSAVLEFILMVFNRFLYHYVAGEIPLMTALHACLRYVAVGALACALAAVFWWNSARRSGKSTTLPAALGLFMAGLAVGCFAAWLSWLLRPSEKGIVCSPSSKAH